MKSILYLLLFISINSICIAQTWTGNTSTDWNTGSNWSGGAVPLPAGNVTIPTSPAGNRWPVLASNITVNNLNMNLNAQLDVNGRTVTAGSADIVGILSNSNANTDISITLTGSGTTYIRFASITDHINYFINGTGTFYDTYSNSTSGNNYSGNVTYTRNAVGSSYIGYYAPNNYNGNVTITSTVPHVLSVFEDGAEITGNLSCTQVGGNLIIGDVDDPTHIAGTLNVMASGPGTVGIKRLLNQTNGGNITLQDRGTTDIFRDTIKVSAITITGQTGPLDFYFNVMTGNLNFTGAVSLSGTSYVRTNTITGTASYTLNGTGTFYDTYSSPTTTNSYSGNVTYQRNGAGTSYIGYYARNQYGGNVSINSTVPHVLSVFEDGAAIAGNFSCTQVGGNLIIGDVDDPTNIAGTLNVSASGTGTVGIKRLLNQTNGGNISLQDRSTTDIFRDTIKVNAITITGQTGALDFYFNVLTGNLNFTGAVSLSGTSFVRTNTITGTASYTLNGTGTFYDTYSTTNTINNYSGNVSYTRNGVGASYIGYYARNQYGSNVTINSTVPHILSVFEDGAAITGNFSCTQVGGNLIIGDVDDPTNISGTVNIVASGSGTVGIKRLLNQTNGGNITLQNRSTTDIFRDTFKVNAITITGQTGPLDFYFNVLTGNLDFTGATTLSGTSYIRSSSVSGNASYTLKGTGTFYDTYSTNTKTSYGGNVSYLRDSTGALYVGYYDTVSIGGNLLFKYSLPGTVNNRFIAFTGNGNSTIAQQGTIPLEFERLSMNKTGNATLTLLDSVRIGNQVYFNGGNIITANQKELIWLSGALSITPSDASKVLGPVVKLGAQAFKFPIGSASDLQAVTMTAPAGATSRFRAEYFLMNPHPTYDTSKRGAGLAAISGCEYWKIDREIGTTNVGLTFDYGGPCLCVEQPTNLRVARWSGSQWTNLGNGGTIGNNISGTVQPTAAVADYGVFTLGTSATVAPGVTIARDVANPVCVCRFVTFTATPTAAGCAPAYQWKKNGVIVGNSSNTYTDSTLVNGDVITATVISSAAFASPLTQVSNSFSITTTDINTWSGITNTNWKVASNWSCQSVPCIYSKVIVNGGAPNACEILSGNVKIISLTANSNSTVRVLNGSTLELKQP